MLLRPGATLASGVARAAISSAAVIHRSAASWTTRLLTS